MRLALPLNAGRSLYSVRAVVILVFTEHVVALSCTGADAVNLYTCRKGGKRK